MFSRVTGLRCTLCGAHYCEPAEGELYTCPACGLAGILDVEYDYEGAWTDWQRTPLADRERSIWRYLPLLPIPEGARLPPLPLGLTPIIEAPELARRLGVADLYIKDDGRLPTASFKDRASSVGAVRALARGYGTVCCASTGNAASSLAGFCASLGLRSVIFVPHTAPEGKLAQLRIFGARVMVVEGSYADAFTLSQRTVEEFGLYNRNAAINPYLVEGKKTCGLEIAEQFGKRLLDWIAISVGDGCTLAGVWKGLKEMHHLGVISRLPRILGVQAAGAAPIHDAFHAGTETVKPQEAHTLADSIAVGVPRNPIKALRAVRESGGSIVTVTDDEILAAMYELARHTGIFGEPAGVAAFGGLRRAVGQGLIGPRDTVLHVVTGSGLKDARAVQGACPPAVRVPADLVEARPIVEAALAEVA